jgi:L-amino acid N-acyltransferase YncA
LSDLEKQTGPEAGMNVRDAQPSDIAALQAIYAEHVLTGLASFEEAPPDIAEITRRLRETQTHGLPFLVATIANENGIQQVSGFAYASPFRTRSAYRYTIEDSVYVASDALGRGLGTALLGELVSRCAALGYRQMVAVIGDTANTASIGLHAHHGFIETGSMPAVGFKFGRWVDSVRMQRPLGPGASVPPDDHPDEG